MEQQQLCWKKISLWNITSSYHHYFFFSCVLGEVLGFENLVFSVFEFICGLTETQKCKKTVKKFFRWTCLFPSVVHANHRRAGGFCFIFYFQPIISSLFCTHIINNRWLLDTCHIDQTITFFAVICLLQGKCGHPIQISLLKMRMMTPFRFLFALQFKMFSW